MEWDPIEIQLNRPLPLPMRDLKVNERYWIMWLHKHQWMPWSEVKRKLDRIFNRNNQTEKTVYQLIMSDISMHDPSEPLGNHRFEVLEDGTFIDRWYLIWKEEGWLD